MTAHIQAFGCQFSRDVSTKTQRHYYWISKNNMSFQCLEFLLSLDGIVLFIGEFSLEIS